MKKSHLFFLGAIVTAAMSTGCDDAKHNGIDAQRQARNNNAYRTPSESGPPPATGILHPASVADYSHKEYHPGRDLVVVGSLLDCHWMDPKFIEKRSPKTYSWMLASGLIEKSSISGTTGYTDKVTSKALGERSLLVGCWVATEFLSEKINGVERVYAKGAYRINEAIKTSPLMDLAVCKKIRTAPAYMDSDYEIMHEVPFTSCATDQFQQQLPNLSALQRENVLVPLDKKRNGSGYVRHAIW